jgi:hypothetical protein
LQKRPFREWMTGAPQCGEFFSRLARCSRLSFSLGSITAHINNPALLGFWHWNTEHRKPA